MNTKSMMLALILALNVLPQVGFSAEPEVSGTITLGKGVDKAIGSGGALFVVAKKPGAPQGTPPVAVLRIPTPQFPQAFSLSSKNVMIPGSKFEGPVEITARYSPSGDALDKSGPQGTPKGNKAVDLGAKEVKIELKVQK